MFTRGTFAILGSEPEPQTVLDPVIARVDEAGKPSEVTLSLTPAVTSPTPPMPVAVSGTIESFSLGGFFSFDSAADRIEQTAEIAETDSAALLEHYPAAPPMSASSARPPIVVRSRSFPRPITARHPQPSPSPQGTPEATTSSSAVETALLETRTDAPALRVNRGMPVAESLPESSVPVSRPNQPSPAVPSAVVAESDPSLLIGEESTALLQEAMTKTTPTAEATSGMFTTEWTATGSWRSTPRRDINSVIDAAWSPTGSTRAEVTPVVPETNQEVAAEIIPLAASQEGGPSPVTLPLIATEFATEPAIAPPPPAERASTSESLVAHEIVGPTVWVREGRTEHPTTNAASEASASTSALPDIVQVCARWWGLPARQVALILAGTGLMLLATGLMLFRAAGRSEGA